MSKTPLILLCTLFMAWVSCSDKPRFNPTIPDYVARMIAHFDTSTLKLFDTLDYSKDPYDPNHRSWYYTAPNQDASFVYIYNDSSNQAAISIYSVSGFNKAFPNRLNLDTASKNYEVHIGLDKRITVHGWKIPQYATPLVDTARSGLMADSAFLNRNPFTYFKALTDTMDSWGVHGVGRHRNGNFIPILIKPKEEAVDYLPDNLVVQEDYRHHFDSVIATGQRINKNWVWRKWNEEEYYERKKREKRKASIQH